MPFAAESPKAALALAPSRPVDSFDFSGRLAALENHTISHRLAEYLEREGILERDEENSYLQLEEGNEGSMRQVPGCSVSYRIAIGPLRGRKVVTLKTISAWEDDDRFAQVAKVSGFSLRAGVAAQAWERKKLERLGGVPLTRYISRPAVSEKRLSCNPPIVNRSYL